MVMQSNGSPQGLPSPGPRDLAKFIEEGGHLVRTKRGKVRPMTLHELNRAFAPSGWNDRPGHAAALLREHFPSVHAALRSVAPGGYLNTGAAQAAVTALAAMQTGAL